VQKPNDAIVFDNLEDIRNGFTRFNEFYIKHFDFRDEINLKNYYDSQLKGLPEIPLEKDQLELLMDKGIWKKKKEGDLNVKKVRLKAAETTLPNLMIESQRRPIETQIEELSKEILELEIEKSEYMGITREAIANTNSYEYILYLSVFNDIDFKEPVFPNKEKDLDNANPDELIALQTAVVLARGICSIETCKKVACSYYVQSMINCLPDDHEYLLIDKPIHTFTVPQINLVQYCSVFRKIFGKYKVPEEIANDPDKILEFPKQAQKLEEIREKNTGSRDLGSGKSYVGATSNEMNDMGMRGMDIHTKLARSGKTSLGKEDLL
jgi:hypothetical protein